MKTFNNINDLINHFQENEGNTDKLFGEGEADFDQSVVVEKDDKSSKNPDGTPKVNSTVDDVISSFKNALDFNVKHGIRLTVSKNKTLDAISESLKRKDLPEQQFNDIIKKLYSSFCVSVSGNPSDSINEILDLAVRTRDFMDGLRNLAISVGRSDIMFETQQKLVSEEEKKRQEAFTAEEMIKRCLASDLPDQEKSLFIYANTQALYFSLVLKLVVMMSSPIFSNEKDILEKEYLSCGEHVVDKIYRDGSVNISKSRYRYMSQLALIAISFKLGEIDSLFEKDSEAGEKAIEELTSVMISSLDLKTNLSDLYNGLAK